MVALIGGIGSGKSLTGAYWALQECVRFWSGRGMILALTFPMLRDATLPAFWEAFGGIIPRAAFKASTMTVQTPGGGEILFRSTEHPDRLRGPNLSWAWLDEAAMMRRLVFDIVMGRLREGGRFGRLCLTTTPRGRDWIWQEWVNGGKWYDRVCLNPANGSFLVRVETFDNPFLSREFIDRLRRQYVGDWAEQELLGKFVRFDGYAFPVDEEKHVVPAADLPSWDAPVDVIVGVDDGWVAPRAAGLWALMGSGRAVGMREHYASYEQPELFVPVLQSWQEETGGRITAVYCDPSAAQLIARLEEGGLPVYAANNSRIPSIRHLRSRFGSVDEREGGILLSESMVNHISEFSKAVHRSTRIKGGEETWTEDIEKVNDHCIDATRYALFSHTAESSLFVV